LLNYRGLFYLQILQKKQNVPTLIAVDKLLTEILSLQRKLLGIPSPSEAPIESIIRQLQSLTTRDSDSESQRDDEIGSLSSTRPPYRPAAPIGDEPSL
jgi:hypothetical protein